MRAAVAKRDDVVGDAGANLPTSPNARAVVRMKPAIGPLTAPREAAKPVARKPIPGRVVAARPGAASRQLAGGRAFRTRPAKDAVAARTRTTAGLHVTR